MSKKRKIFAADLFCGAGGTSTGMLRACEKMGIDVDLLAVNHWTTAIETHTDNHPNARHLCMTIDKIKPEKAVPGGRLHLLVASPECTHHSKARGGKPMNDQSRATAWDILNWANKLVIDNILIENVKEFKDWGPLGVNGRPLKSKKGTTFQSFIDGLRVIGYNVEYQVLNAANYGDATTRERLFVIARRGNKKIVWPETSHAQHGQDTIFAEKKPWRSAREIIDWSIKGKSLMNRKKPLAPATMKRIEAGLKKFGGQYAEPFLVILRQHMAAQSIDQPCPTITAGGQHIALCEPFVLGQQSGSAPRSVEDPIPTVSTDGAIALVQPFVVTVDRPETNRSAPRTTEDPLPTITGSLRVGLVEPFLMVNRNNNVPKSLEEPVPTLCTGNHMALVEPFIVPQFSEGNPKSVEDPLGTITTTSRGIGLCEPYLVRFQGNREADMRRNQSLDIPLGTLDTSNRYGLVDPFIVPFYGEREGQEARTHSIKDPLPTVTGHGAGALVEPYLVEFYGNGQAQSIHDPLPTVTTKDRFGLVTIDGTQYKVDIRFRMLQPHELAAAMSFPKDYRFAGNREAVVKQIGNAVPGYLSEALCKSLLV
jgi:DNA (cytosine-5)-methyltransferase 1